MGLNTISKRVSDIATAVKRTFGDESGVQVSDADIIRWVNEAQTEIAMSNKVLKGRSVRDLVANTGFYNLPDNVLQIESIHVNSVPLTPKTLTEMEATVLQRDPKRTEQDITPQYWWEYAGGVEFFPVPSTGAVGGITIYFVRSPVDTQSASDMLGLPDKYYQTMINLVLAKAYELDENFEAVTLKVQQAANSLSTFVNEEEQAAHRRYPSIVEVED